MVYRVSWRECEAVYVSETMRNLAVRHQEHKRHSVNGDIHRSAVAEHVFKCQHRIGWDSAKIVGTELGWRRRKIKEALRVSRQKYERPVMNKDDGWTLSAVWREQMRN